MGANIVWAHLIVSRVRRRLADVSRGAAHVFVDSVITKDVLPVGDAPGDWHLVKDYPHGVRVRGPGAYGPLAGPLDRYAGVAKSDPRRHI
jgi:hypothetical protein